MSFTYDLALLAQPLMQVRLLTDDTEEQYARFQDEELAALLNLNDSEPKLAAAAALDITAGRQALILKVIRQLDLSMDGAKVAQSLHALADELRRQVHEEDGALFDVAEMVYDDFSWRERVFKQFLREEV